MLAKVEAHKKQAYLLILGLMMASLPLSRYFMSVSQFLLLALWLFDGMDLSRVAQEEKSRRFQTTINEIGQSAARQFKKFLRNKPAVLFASIYLMHVIGVLYSSDLHFALKDLRIKLPLLSLPVLFSALPALSRKEVYHLLGIHALAVLGGTLSSVFLFFYTGNTEFRDLFPYFSHIRFSLNAVLAVFNLAYLIVYTGYFSKKYRLGAIALAAWVVLFLFIFKSFTGIIAFLIVAGIVLIVMILRTRGNLIRIPFLLLLIAIPAFITWNFIQSYRDYTVAPVPDFEKLDKKTTRGNPYTHDTLLYKIENGRYVGLYISWQELEKAWNKRSSIDFDSVDKKNQQIKHTIVRYLNSMGLRKDAKGVQALTKQDIRNIENGIANKSYTRLLSVRSRFDKIIMGYLNYKRKNDPSGSSIMQRFEYWKASVSLIERNPVIGVGTGDVKTGFKKQYDRMDSKLPEKQRRRAHNQFLAITVGFGFIGLAWFLVAFFYPPWQKKGYNMILFNLHLLIVILSMLYEDTLEPQPGVTFVAFFYAMYLFGLREKENASP